MQHGDALIARGQCGSFQRCWQTKRWRKRQCGDLQRLSAPRRPDTVFLLVMQNVSPIPLHNLDTHPLTQFLSLNLVEPPGQQAPGTCHLRGHPQPLLFMPSPGEDMCPGWLHRLESLPFTLSPVRWLPGQPGNSLANARGLSVHRITELMFASVRIPTPTCVNK